MRYYLDTEFDGFGGPLISLALVREDGESLYIVYEQFAKEQWVRDNVIPILWNIPSPFPGGVKSISRNDPPGFAARMIGGFLANDPQPLIISDWPDDIAYLCKALIVGPGQMVETSSMIDFRVRRVDAYPTMLPGAVQHNAWWDAQALRYYLKRDYNAETF